MESPIKYYDLYDCKNNAELLQLELRKMNQQTQINANVIYTESDILKSTENLEQIFVGEKINIFEVTAYENCNRAMFYCLEDSPENRQKLFRNNRKLQFNAPKIIEVIKTYENGKIKFFKLEEIKVEDLPTPVEQIRENALKKLSAEEIQALGIVV